jgi:mannitol/fructose-specific phosphotransferase system IIA component (Ntr-type)
MKLTDILDPGCIRIPLQSTDKTGAITELVDLLHKSGQLNNRDDVLKAVLARERMRSTAIGHGLAVPHGKCAGCSKLVMALGKPADPIDFGGRDGKPASVIALLASPPSETGPHIQALARISRLMLRESFRVALARAYTAEEAFELINSQDNESDK